MNTNERKTPRTDAEIKTFGSFNRGTFEYVKPIFARQLERELEEAREEVAELSRNRCDTCGAKIYSGPPDCPMCGAPNCCQQCCTIETQKIEIAMLRQSLTSAERERDSALSRCRALEGALRFIRDECDWKSTDAMGGGDDRIGPACTKALSSPPQAEQKPQTVLREVADGLSGVLDDVMEWIDNWSPNFTDDDGWPATKNEVKRAQAHYHQAIGGRVE